MNAEFFYQVEIKSIYISEGHAFQANRTDTPRDFPLQSVSSVEAIKDAGLKGDRFCNFERISRGQVTFFAEEVYDALSKKFPESEVNRGVFRRNIITRGVALNSLIGKQFELGGILFEGSEECAPCRWMDACIAEGAKEFLRDRGGLRAKILSSGMLSTGPVAMKTSVEFSADQITRRLGE